jgi:undecaprenyl diphosphate synthase
MAVPRHVAIVMDGNGRWAAARGLPRQAGHKAGVGAVRAAVEHCARRGVEALTLFAFSSENWRRPETEVAALMSLFLEAIDREVDELHEKRVRLRFIGDRGTLSVRLQARMAGAESLTAANDGLKLQVAVSYGGRWDLLQAARAMAAQCASGRLSAADLTEERLAAHLALAGLPEPDLFIRTGGEQRISNFMLWELAYTELYFSACLWPQFDAAELDAAFAHFAARERRFGLTGGQRTDAARA